MKRILIVIGIVILVSVIGFVGLRIYTKQFSPHDEATLQNDEVSLSVSYSRPYKKERVIFGGLVPYNKVWRTGANEATTFTTSKDLKIKGKILPAGKYSLFTKPSKNQWQIIFNKETGQWGIDPFSGNANRDETKDALTIEVGALDTPDVFEQFTIAFNQMGEDIEMVLMWDQTLVVVPIMVAN